jgi:flagellar basal-body rod protein FlgB
MLPALQSALHFQGEALVLRAHRQRVLAGNIANADTPGFQARDFVFADALRAATAGSARPAAGGGVGGAGAANALGSPIAPRAMSTLAAFGEPGTPAAGPGSATPELRYATVAQDSVDRNTVDLDRERAAFADNAVRYEASLRFLNGSVRTMLDAMRSANAG